MIFVKKINFLLFCFLIATNNVFATPAVSDSKATTEVSPKNQVNKESSNELIVYPQTIPILIKEIRQMYLNNLNQGKLNSCIDPNGYLDNLQNTLTSPEKINLLVPSGQIVNASSSPQITDSKIKFSLFFRDNQVTEIDDAQQKNLEPITKS